MNYVEVVVSQSFGEKDAGKLTYHAGTFLAPGSLVVVPHGKKEVAGVVWSADCGRPSFKTKSIIRSLDLPPLSNLRREWLEWISGYYASGLSKIVAAVLPSGLSRLKESNLSEDLQGPDLGYLPALTDDQQRVLRAINKKGPTTHWLHAETGAGKTRIYLELARQALHRDKNVLILIPEIALAAQTYDELTETYGHSTILYNSQLPLSQRRNIWIQASSQTHRPRIWIGTRSALFLPISNLGLIVIDESHDPSYIQEQAPRYQAPHIAAKLAQLSHANLILGSATPSISEIYLGHQKNLPVHRIYDPVRKPKESKVEVVDLRSLSNRSKFSPWISRQLESGLEDTLRRHEQAILFINRRGNSPLVLCGHCGWQATCGHCHLPLTYHADKYLLSCHICGRLEKAVMNCPNCNEPDLLFKGCGTKEVELILKKRFPQARLLRFDSDNIKASEAAEAYHSMKKGQVDFIIGTQMIVKGFDLPRVSLIGLIHADAGMSMPDFSSMERSFQLIYQAVGRSGRHSATNHVIVQSFRPDHPVITAAIKHDWDGFYKFELQQRKSNNFPPFRFTIKLTARKTSENAARKILSAMIPRLKDLVYLGPAPALHSRSGKYHIWNLVLLSHSRQRLLEIANKLPAGVHAELDPTDWL